jgi:hypothetical protein
VKARESLFLAGTTTKVRSWPLNCASSADQE